GSGARIVEQSRAERRRRRHIRQLCTASALAVVLVAAGASLWRSAPPALPVVKSLAPSSLVVSTPVRQELPDGSIVELKEGARISVQFAAQVRRVRLEQGEAHFKVTKNAARPFVVSAGAVDVRAVGTEFSVDLGAQRVGVLVTEGRVAVERDAPEPLAMLDAGQSTAVELQGAAAPAVLAAPLDEQRTRLAWRVPRLELSSTPLAEVVECFNRHGAVRLELADPSLGALQLSGVLRVDSPHALLHVLKNDFGLREERRADDTIVLRRP
ncbi:MAG TPA: FecR domain-containing protein, partial [Opitutaceae bacterium]